MLTEFISNQKQSLETLELNDNYFSGSGTEKFLNRIVEQIEYSNIKELNLSKSIYLVSDQSIRDFTDILAIAPKLKKCDNSNQRSFRKIGVEIEYANQEEMGSIVIKDLYTGNEIHRR